MSCLRIGTCSWKYDSWRGIIYPKAGVFDYLQEYARSFDTVEIDQWFWSLFAGNKAVLPKPADVERYARAVPDGFRFTIKAPNSVTLTHHYRREKSEPLLANPHFLSVELFRDFLACLNPMQGKIGLVMLQFEYLNKQKMASPFGFLERLGTFLHACRRDPPLAIEIRNPAWLDERYFRFLRQHNVHHVFCQGYYMPAVWDSEQKFADLLTDTTSIRLMGSDRKGMEIRSGDRWDRLVNPKDDELAHIAAMVSRLRKRRKSVYLSINNHYEGSAPLTAHRIAALITEGETAAK